MDEARLNRAYLLLGSNIAKERNMVEALRLLSEAVHVAAVSSVYETGPIGNTDQERFLNAAVLVETPLSADALKRKVLGSIEGRLGRRRTADKNAPRTIDIDIVVFNERPVRREELTRAHVVVPLADIAPGFRPPETTETLAEIAARLFRQGGMVRVPLPFPEPRRSQ